MPTDHPPADDRRATPRIAARGHADATVLDAAGQPIARRVALQLLDISGEGLGLVSDTAEPIGTRLRVTPDAAPGASVEVVVVTHTQAVAGSPRTRLGCRVTAGAVPAALALDW